MHHRVLTTLAKKRPFSDSVTLQITAGKGGNGSPSYLSRGAGKRTPDGGHGGMGGSIVIRAVENLRTLGRSTFHIVGNDGTPGASKGMSGRRGEDKTILVPVGTCVYKAPPTRREQQISDEEEEKRGDWFPSTLLYDKRRENSLIADLSKPEDSIIVAKGGYGGRGNIIQVAQSFQFFEPLKDDIRKGKPGEKISVLLKLKSIADAGFVGFPNAGKSSLLGAISTSRPKVASYPFTTLHPHIGYVEYTDGNRISVADLPGLVDGAHENKGLGHEFLQHIERTRVLIYVLDVCPSYEGRNRSPGEDFLSLVNELDMYQPGLSQRPSMIVANKMDSKDALKGLESLRKALSVTNNNQTKKIVSVSALSGVGIAQFVKELRLFIEETNYNCN